MALTRKKFWAVCVIGALVAFGLVCTNFLLGRPDRIRAAENIVAMDHVRDQVWRFELEHGRLPVNLNELVPAYIQKEQIESASGPVYQYDPSTRLLVEAEGALITGLITYRRKPVRDDLGMPRGNISNPEIKTVPAPPPPPVAPIPKAVVSAPAFIVPTGPDNLPDPPAGAYVFEAEYYSEMNYGWEAHLDPACSGGVNFRTKRAIGNGPGQLRIGVRNFYDIHDDHSLFSLKYHVHIPETGTYYIYGRMWTTDTHCANAISFSVDHESAGTGDSMENRTPFCWVWSEAYPLTRHLTAGDHFVHVFIHEAGLFIDQFILSPTPISGSSAYKPNLLPGKDTAWQMQPGPVAQMTFDLATMVITPQMPPDCKLVLRRLRPATGKAALRVVLRGAGASGEDLPVATSDVDLAALPEIGFMPLKFSGLNLEKLPRREYLLQAVLTPTEGPEMEAHVALLKPFVWEVFGPGKYLEFNQSGPLDGDGEPKAGDKRVWTPLAESSYDPFGIMDFGLQTSGNAANAPTWTCIYARTRIHVPKDDDYIFLVQADDEILVWIDGKQVYGLDTHTPVTRSARKVKIHLSAGDHRVRMRVNQQTAYWQAALRIRAADESLSDVTGLEAATAPVAQPAEKTTGTPQILVK